MVFLASTLELKLEKFKEDAEAAIHRTEKQRANES
jgi:hypothetical protein